MGVNIVRYAGDTYPTKVVIKINGVPIDLKGWDVNLRYMDENDNVRVVDCKIADPESGKVLIYPHDRPDYNRIESDSDVIDIAPSEFVTNSMLYMYDRLRYLSVTEAEIQSYLNNDGTMSGNDILVKLQAQRPLADQNSITRVVAAIDNAIAHYAENSNVFSQDVLNSYTITINNLPTEANQCWTVGGMEFPYRIVRRKQFGDYEEAMTHVVGKVIILNAV